MQIKKSAVGLAAVLVLCGSVATGQSTGQPKDSVEAATERILSHMTLEEKLSLIGGQGMTTTTVAGLPSIKMSDGPAGLRTWGPSDAYPVGIALAATFDPMLARDEGASLARDAKARGVNVLLAPGVNLYRQPMNGRNFEYFGEDPYLSSRMAVGYIEGLQANGVAGTVKHFVANNSEFDRNHTNSIVDERTLHEIYLPAFEAAVKEAYVAAVMDSYNLVNGQHMTENGLLNTQVLKKQWGFDGVVMSDWSATHDGLAAANGGLDLEMPKAKFMTAETLMDALKAGKISQATIDDKVRRIVRFSLRYGTSAAQPEEKPGPTNTVAARKQAYAVAAESIVLLKNDGAILPLDAGKVRRVAVIGPAVFPQMVGGGGSSYTTTLEAPNLYSALVAGLGPAVQVLYSPGIPTESEIFAQTKFDGPIKQEKFSGDAFQGVPETSDVQHVDRWVPSFKIGNPQAKQASSYRWTAAYTARISGRYFFLIGSHGSDTFTLYVDEKPVMQHARIEGTGPKLIELRFTAGQHVKVRLDYVQRGAELDAGLGVVSADEMVLPAARKMAASADAVVVGVGFGFNYESEAFDRTWQLPVGQDELIASMTAANGKTVVLLNAGGSVDTSHWGELPAGLLHAWYGGEEGGDALADVLTGKVNPSGKLPISFERRLEDDAAFTSYYPNEGSVDVPYSEGIFIGYRHFDRAAAKPLFPFGFGLSYTTFAMSHLQVEDAGNARVKVSLDVRNTGSRPGDDVVQVYVGEENPQVPRPVKELKAFQRMHVEPGRTKHVEVMLNDRSFSYWDTDSHDWKRDAGRFSIFVGDSSTDLPLRQHIALKP